MPGPNRVIAPVIPYREVGMRQTAMARMMLKCVYSARRNRLNHPDFTAVCIIATLNENTGVNFI